MSLFVLRKEYRVETTPGGGRVVHLRTGDELHLSATEVQILARASAAGVDPEDENGRAVVRKLIGFGLLEPSEALAAPPGMVPAAPRPIAATTPDPEAAVPLFRVDLTFTRRPSSEILDYTDPTNGKIFPLYEFEASLARMLDGRRRYAEVVEAGRNLGIPVTLESLGQFVRQFERYGFLAAPGSTPPQVESEEKATRRKWDESLRSLYQTGLRFSRQGKVEEALGYFNAMLEQDPTNAEALRMIEQLRQSPSGSDPSSAAAAASALEVITLDPIAPPPAGAEVRPQAKSRSGLTASLRRVVLGSLAVALVLAGVGAATLAYLRANAVSSAPSVRPRATSGSRAPAPGKTGTSSGAMATKADLPPSAAAQTGSALDGGGTAEAAAPTGVAVNADRKPGSAGPTVNASGSAVTSDAGASAAVPDTAASQTVAPAAPPAQRPKNAVAGPSDVPLAVHPPASSGRGLVVPLDKRGRVTMGTLEAPSEGVLVWSAASEQRVRKGDSLGTLTSGGRAIALEAPKAGLLFHPVPAGAVKKGAHLAEIAYPEAYLQAVVVGSDRPSGAWNCEVFDSASGNSASCKVVVVTARGKGFFVTATAEPTWIDKADKPALRLTPP